MPSLRHIIRFTTDASALEKILRLLQSLAQILAAFAVSSEEVKTWLLLRRQFALGRRYFRFFKFVDCFQKAYEAFYSASGLGGVLLVGKWSCMGGYMMLESSTILDAIGVWPTPWAQECMLEANRFWFYSLVFSIILGLMLLFARGLDNKHSNAKQRELEKRPVTKEVLVGRQALMRRLLTDSFDLFIPGHITGWIYTSPTFVGFASVVSTLLASKDIWDRLR